MMFAILLRRAKQVCAQRNREGGVVDLHGDERSGALAGAVPARTDLDSACSVAEEQPPFGGIFSRRRLRSNDGDRGIAGERVQAAGIAVAAHFESSDEHQYHSISLRGKARSRPEDRKSTRLNSSH